ncbi:MAG TPA: hypothetical protein VJK07_03245 [Candidatus Nanoarchaeia archaeon]|nr:hypothetical protein [Candidatus Nanoarchaeia archaeon]
MTKIIIDVPEELERRARLLKVELSILAAKALKDQVRKLEEIVEFRRIIAKSRATDSDVEELSNEVKDAVWRRHLKH